MPALSRLGTQIEEIVSTLNAVGARFALIGGLALASHKVVRATSDVDLLTDAGTAEQIHREMTRLDYSCLHRSAEVANYLRGDQRVDYLFASRPTARQLLEGAEDRITSFGTLRVISAEGLIAFKLQGIVNNPRRTQDLEDIKPYESPGNATSHDIIAAEGGVVAPVVSHRDPYEVLDDLMCVVEALCPTWPQRAPFTGKEKFRL